MIKNTNTNVPAYLWTNGTHYVVADRQEDCDGENVFHADTGSGSWILVPGPTVLSVYGTADYWVERNGVGILEGGPPWSTPAVCPEATP